MLNKVSSNVVAFARLESQSRSGNLSALEGLYRSHGGKMKSIAYNLLGNQTDAEDAVQDAFLKIHRSWASFRGGAALSTWAFRILVNTCCDMGRKRRRRPIEEPEADAGHSPVSTAGLALRRALGQLNERRLNVFLLYEVEGFKHAEIGAVLDISEAMSKLLLFEAKKELRERLGR